MSQADHDHRPLKRRKIEASDCPNAAPTCQQLVLEEIDVELGLRQRLYETVQSRLTWALLLQEALEKEYKPKTGDDDDFQAAALDALRVAEEPSKPLFDREVLEVERPPISPPPVSSTEPPLHPRNVTRGTSSRARDRGPVQPARKLLFLRNTNTDPLEIAKLACPDCARSDFSNLQGLLNHCRIRHSREFGSHDECIQSCAVIVPDEERDWVVASGTELGGISLPSLRRLFELAVGAGDIVRIPGLRKESEPTRDTATAGEAHTDVLQTEPGASTELTKTLGYHKDTPALAPFLGREPKKRVINVYDDPDKLLDILGDCAGPTNSLAARQGWRKHYSHRNAARAELDEVLPNSAEHPVVHSPNDHPHCQTPAEFGSSAAVGVASSRFHIVARVKVADSSLWISPDRRRKDAPDHTHRWRLAVSSPSYSLHITTFLEKLTVTCLFDPPSTLVNPITVTEPPFAVTSTTDRPFLARLTFTWAGGNANPPLELEHWVDTDPLHLGHPVLGDEQVFDVELDRNTQLLPVRADVRKLAWKDGDGVDNVRDDLGGKIEGSAAGDEQGVKATLRMLLQQVPITVRDARARKQAAPGPPTFALVPTPAQYRNLTPGRRKAIELSRARALLAAYREHVDIASASPTPVSQLPPLTVGDVYRWMEEERLFPRDASAAKTTKDDDRTGSGKAAGSHQVLEAYCRFCGLRQSLHPGAKTEDDASKDTKPPLVAVCTEFNAAPAQPPLLDVQKLLEYRPGDVHGLPHGLSQKLWTTASSNSTPKRSPSSADLVAIAHPGLLAAVRALAAEWHLANLQAPIPPLQDTAGDLESRAPANRPRHELLDDLAPYAMLTAALGCMVRLLVRSGLDAVQRDEAAQRGLVRRSRGKVETASARRLLTPSHISRGLTDNAGRGLAESAALVCLAGLGFKLATSARERERVVTGPALGVHAESVVKVKEEEEDA